jgi:7-cyano-7-deazaguanine synthase
MTVPNKALVLFSGGQDSTTCLAWALEQYTHVETIGFQYGQRNHAELVARPAILSEVRNLSPAWNQRLKTDHLMDFSLLKALSDSALTSETAISLMQNGLPNTFVPGRNLFFLLAAATLAYRRGINVLVGGMGETDSSGYPDCRESTITAFEQSINLGMDSRIRIQTPLMHKDKAAIWQLAKDIGGDKLLELIRVETHTCYLNERTKLYDWGYGCSDCPACLLRSNGYKLFSQKIPASEQH